MRRLSFPDPPLTDGVIRLRPWGETDVVADAAALAAAWADPEVLRWLPVPRPERRAVPAAAAWIAGTADRLASGLSLDLVVAPVDQASTLVLGEVGLGPIDWAAGEARIGYWVAAPARGRGTATGAVRLLARFAESALGLSVVAEIDAANVASRRVATRAGVACRVRV
jgi:RimJ/RimL family protein N-acetyltransferase